MDKEKQIEEIKELADGIYINCPACLLEDEAEMIAKYVIENKGYRKASDVAREIFAEIEKMLKNRYHSNKVSSEDSGIMITVKHSARTSFATALHDIAELKKKYESEDKRD